MMLDWSRCDQPWMCRIVRVRGGMDNVEEGKSGCRCVSFLLALIDFQRYQASMIPGETG